MEYDVHLPIADWNNQQHPVYAYSEFYITSPNVVII